MNARGMAADRHIPVLRDRIVDLLAPALAAPGAVYLDGTLGMGGHAEAILQRCPDAHVVGIDRDQEALALAAERLAPYAAQVTFVHSVYDEVSRALAEAGVDHVDAALYDLASRPSSSTRPTAASPTARTPRWTCGWTSPRG